ncbi:flavin reductase family protein [Phaeobacter sp. HF9A]|uniref:flavin reductase family protein n=1 Tax=Phaeobacter sp. HF9A TaxID=2721561 RepID=UPI00142FFCB4|nr:flavin reductase family protein [Phaeobacter sp. HF9A]NIZ11969.1 flavin reductase [Phaeobacter sp. HF9A]
MAVDIATFRQTMALFPGAVTLITTGSGDLRRGITATAVCSVTDSPPTLLVCVNRKTGTCAQILATGRFSVQLLTEEQADLAMAFAGAGGLTGLAKFDDASWGEGPTGLPQHLDALASISCKVASSTENGSHQVFFGQIEHVTAKEGEALIYAKSRFHRLAAVV